MTVWTDKKSFDLNRASHLWWVELDGKEFPVRFSEEVVDDHDERLLKRVAERKILAHAANGRPLRGILVTNADFVR